MKALILALVITVLCVGAAFARDWNIEQGDTILNSKWGGDVRMLRAQAYYLRSIAQSLNIMINAPNENERARLSTEEEDK